jgi:HD-like signal output (HDOD) protein
MDEAYASKTDIALIEKAAFGIDHQEIGYFMAVKWRFPEEFAEVIRGHHSKPDGGNRLLDLVKVADKFIENPKADLGAEGMILDKEKGRIAEETKRISALLGVSDGN